MRTVKIPTGCAARGVDMSKAITQIESTGVVLRLQHVIKLSDEQLFELCQINQDLWIERTAEGELVIMPPEDWETGIYSANFVTLLTQWAWQDGTGASSGSSAGFILPNGAMRSPDAAWVLRSRLSGLTAEQKQRFLPLCPDFVVEIRSPSGCLSAVQAKMQEYLDNGARLGWLIDPPDRQVCVYRPNQPVERLDNPATVSGDPVLAGFILDPQRIWESGF